MFVATILREYEFGDKNGLLIPRPEKDEEHKKLVRWITTERIASTMLYIQQLHSRKQENEE